MEEKIYTEDNGVMTVIGEMKDIHDIINVVNNVVTTTTNGTSSVQNLEDLKVFLNQALTAWQNAMRNQTVFQYQFPYNK